MKFILNDCSMGECESYRQDRSENVWIFDVGSNRFVVPFDSIKYFSSSPALSLEVDGDITMFHI